MMQRSTSMQLTVLLAATALFCGAQAAQPPTVRASIFPPGGLAPLMTPQFVLLTHEGPINQAAYDLVTAVTVNKTSNGCAVRATLFAPADGTDCELAIPLWMNGFEIASNTDTRPEGALNMTQVQLRAQAVGGRQKLAACGIPEATIRGFRAPQLESKLELRAVLKNNFFLYDSSLVEDAAGRSITRNMSARVWPWDMANGIPINCSTFSGQRCLQGEAYPGLFEVPVWTLAGASRPTNPGQGSTPLEVLNLLKANFDATLYGNRAPFPVYVDSPWLAANRAALEQFIAYAKSKPNVFFVTMQQLVGWMKDPIPIGQLSPTLLGCNNTGGIAATAEQKAARPPPPPLPPSPAPPKPPSPAKAEASKSPVLPPATPAGTPVPVYSPTTNLELPTVTGGASPNLATLSPDSASLMLSPDPSSLMLPDGALAPAGATALPAIVGDPLVTNTRPMPASGVRIGMTVGGLDLARFQSITEPQLLAVLRQRLTATANGAPVEVYVASVSAVPAGVTLAGDASGIGAGAGRRRSLRQATGEWLQMVLVANGPDPLAMYAAIKKAVRDGAIGTVFALSGGYLVPPTTVVPFKDGMDLDPSTGMATEASAPAPPPAASTDAPAETSSSSGMSTGAIVGAAVGGAVVLLAVVGLVYWKCLRRPGRTGASQRSSRPSTPGGGSGNGKQHGSGSRQGAVERFKNYRAKQAEKVASPSSPRTPTASVTVRC